MNTNGLATRATKNMEIPTRILFCFLETPVFMFKSAVLYIPIGLKLRLNCSQIASILRGI